MSSFTPQDAIWREFPREILNHHFQWQHNKMQSSSGSQWSEFALIFNIYVTSWFWRVCLWLRWKVNDSSNTVKMRQFWLEQSVCFNIRICRNAPATRVRSILAPVDLFFLFSISIHRFSPDFFVHRQTLKPWNFYEWLTLVLSERLDCIVFCCCFESFLVRFELLFNLPLAKKWFSELEVIMGFERHRSAFHNSVLNGAFSTLLIPLFAKIWDKWPPSHLMVLIFIVYAVLLKKKF